MSTPAEQDITILLLVLSQLPGIGPARLRALVQHFGASPEICEAGEERLAQVPGIGEILARETSGRLANTAWRTRARNAAEDQMERALRLQASIVTLLDPAYPSLLKEIYDPPPVLFVRGKLPALSLPSIAVVGTRKATSYGKQATGFICQELVRYGYAILSGLAYGIDMTAHRTAVENGGTTIAILGCGIDTIYTDPAGRIWPKIIEQGAIVSEEWIGTEPAPGNFPRRNRLIAGMTLGTLVVESDVKGGSMITASSALDQNREVFAVPGSIFSRASRGTNLLLQRSHAKAVLSAGDILAELSPEASATPARPPGAQPSLPNLSREESSIVDILEEEAMHIDLIAEKTGLSIDTLLVHLFELEMKRVIDQEPGQLFRKNRLYEP